MSTVDTKGWYSSRSNGKAGTDFSVEEVAAWGYRVGYTAWCSKWTRNSGFDQGVRKRTFSEPISACPMAYTINYTDSFLSYFCKPKNSSICKTPRIGHSEDYLARLLPNDLAYSVKDEQNPAVEKGIVVGKRLTLIPLTR